MKDWALDQLQGSEERVSRARAELIPSAMRAVASLLRPAGTEAIAVECAKLADWAVAFNIPAKDFKAAAKAYGEALAYLPRDLLVEAFNAVKATHKWGMRLPLPAEIAQHVSERLAERRKIEAKLKIAQRCPVEDDPGGKSYAQMSEFEKREFNERMDELRGRGRFAPPQAEPEVVEAMAPPPLPPSPGQKRQAEAAALIAARIHRDAGHPLTPGERLALERAAEPTERQEERA